jgi:hypothetical protein
MRTKITIIILLLVLVISIFILNRNNKDFVVTKKNNDITYIIVNTPESRTLGLSGRESLPEDTAMLFVFDKPGIYKFWMKDMNFPIDIIWLDENKKIIHIEENIAPETYPASFGPEKDSLYVLEANAGFASKKGLQVGKVLDLQN